MEIRLYRRHSIHCPEKDNRVANCGCPIWMQFQDRPNHQVKKSTGKTDWNHARRVATERAKVQTSVLIGDPGEGEAAVDSTLAAAIERYIYDKIDRGLGEETVYRAKLLLSRLQKYASTCGVVLLRDVTPLLLDDFRRTWSLRRNASGEPATYAWVTYGQVVKTFFNWAYKRELITKNPAERGLERIKIKAEPTLPYDREEVDRILAAVDTMRWTDSRRRRVRAMILVARWAGLAARDVALLRTDALGDDNVITVGRAKTGVEITVPVPDFVARALRDVETGNSRLGYFFWTGCKPVCAAHTVTRAVGAAVKAAGIERKGGNVVHRFRDTFAIELILADVRIEDVSMALGHSSIRVTQAHYAPWIEERRRTLAAKIRGSWPRQGIAALARKQNARATSAALSYSCGSA